MRVYFNQIEFYMELIEGDDNFWVVYLTITNV